VSDKLLELAERCEKATGPDRELDMRIALAFGLLHHEQGGSPYADEYTASVDLAIPLVGTARFILDKRAFAGTRSGGYRADVWQAPLTVYGETTRAWAVTPALALCAAALRAKAAA
jgi:hypothetical protein